MVAIVADKTKNGEYNENSFSDNSISVVVRFPYADSSIRADEDSDRSRDGSDEKCQGSGRKCTGENRGKGGCRPVRLMVRC